MAKRAASMTEGKSKRAKRMTTKPSLQTMVRREIMKQAEIKEITNYASGTASTTSGTVVCINQIAEGDDYNNRTGRKIQTVGIDVMYAYKTSSGSLSTAQVALVYDSQPDGTTATYNTIFDLAYNAGMAFKNTFTNGERFKIFWMTQLPESDSSDSGTGWLHRKRRFISTKQIGKHGDVKFPGTTAAVPQTGAWYLCFGDQYNTTTTSQISYVVKYQFTDL